MNKGLEIIGVIITLLVMLGLSYFYGKYSCDRIIETRTDTVVVTQTIRDTILIPVEKRIVRTETIFVEIPGDSIKVEYPIQIEQKVYKTDDYRAVIEGFHANLVEMEIYQKQFFITKTNHIKVTDKKRWGFGPSIGVSYILTENKIYPYVGISLQYNLIRW